MFIFINIPCWDIQCTSKECANITHSLVGLFLAGNFGKNDIQCPLMECANKCTLHNRSLDVLKRYVHSLLLRRRIMHFENMNTVRELSNIREALPITPNMFEAAKTFLYVFESIKQ